MVLKRGVTKNVLLQGVWPVYMGIGIATKKGVLRRKGWRKKVVMIVEGTSYW